MGIQGLIPFLEKSSKPVSISQFAGCTVAIDAYCWLHKGAFSCADKLARGDKTDVYVNYCMKYVNMLLSHNIKPILVFDGRHLPAKADTEKKRRQNREVNRRRAAELLRQDKPNEARTYLQRCVDVTHTMATQLMRECRGRNVDCITAPYEADAQLAYLNINNIAHIVITEDSDLLLFGCTRVIFKLDLAGNGLLVEQERLHLSMGLSEGMFTMDKFRYMCILSGCDYLPSLPKIGLAKALRFVKSTVDPDIHRALSRLGGHLNMSISVPLEYRDKFLEADAMFRHQPVFDPQTRRLVPLTPPPPGAPPPPLLAQEPLEPSQLRQLAYGNLDPFTLQVVDDWSPEKTQTPNGRSNGWNAKAPHKSIWSPDFKPKVLVIEKPDPCNVKRSSTSGKVVERSVEIPKLPLKRPAPSIEEEMNALRSQFGSSPHPNKKVCLNDVDEKEIFERIDQTPTKTESKAELMDSPKKTPGNPFSKATPTVNKFSGLSKLAKFRKTSPSDSTTVQSRYFGQAATPQPVDKSLEGERESKSALKDCSNKIETQTKPKSPQKSPFAVPSIDRLSDTGINSLIDDLENESKFSVDGDIKKSGGKENSSVESVQVKRENSFRWKPSLAEIYGFKTNPLQSSPAVNNKFVRPSLNESVDENNGLSKDSPKDVQSVRRNPFAKTAKVEESQDDLGSQGNSFNDSESDILTPDTNSESSFCSPPKIIRKPQMKVGLSKKNDKCQKSLLTMFAFKPKPKLQR